MYVKIIKMNKRILIYGITFLGFCTFYFLLLVSGPRLPVLHISKFNINEVLFIKSFTEHAKTDTLISAPRFDAVKEVALAKVNSAIKSRNTLNIFYQALCILSLIVSFLLSIIGASRGIFIDPDKVKENFELLKDQEKSFKKYILIISSISILLTAVANRLNAYTQSEQSKANEIIDVLKSAELKITTALSLNEVNAIVNNLELDVSKY